LVEFFSEARGLESGRHASDRDSGSGSWQVQMVTVDPGGGFRNDLQ